MYQSLYNTEYGEHRDKVNDWNTEQNRLDQNYYNEANLDYNKFTDNRSYYTDLYNTALTWATNDANTDYSNRFAEYQQGVSEEQWAKNYALQQAQLAETKRANDQSAAIAALKQQLAAKDDEISALKGTDFSKFTKSQWYDYFSGIKQSKGTAAAQTELNKLIKEGTIPKDVITLISTSVIRGGRLGH